jgi:CBS domain containing-hemolysin-like protein
MILELLAALLLVLANGFFVATEFALARLRPTQVDEFLRDGKPGARSVRHAVDHIDAYLAACQLGITLASLGLGVVGEPVFHDLLEPLLGDSAAIAGVGLAVAMAFGIITVLHVVVGELAPKSLAIASAGPVSLFLAPPMRLFYLLTKPVVDLFNGMGNLLLKPFGVPPASEAGHAPHSEDELRGLLSQSAREGLIEADEGEFTERVLVFGDRRAREVMVPRPDVRAVDTDDDLAAAVRCTVETGHTRLPLCEPEGGLDTVVGLLHAKDLLPVIAERRDVGLRELARPVLRVPDALRVDELLRHLRSDRQHLALVEDEHGTVVGLVTLEDVLEEIVGEIEDEFDLEEVELLSHDGEATLVDGHAPLRLVAERLGLQLEEPHEATVGGHLLERLGRVPEPGEEVELDGRQAEVSRVEGARIARLRFPDVPSS